MAWNLLFLLTALAVMASGCQAKVVEHTFRVGSTVKNLLCEDRVVTVVNGKLPGPTVYVREGDTLVVNVINESPYDMAIHWHGIFQLQSAWADGAGEVTQCPIRPGKSFTYKFDIIGQEGTLWWHAHIATHRATVYGALIILPRAGSEDYPFPRPDKEVILQLGEWWNSDIIDVDNEAYAIGAGPNASDAFTINGRPGDWYPCKKTKTYRLMVDEGKTYLLRIISATLNNELFFRISGHNMTVVAVDATYTTPYTTDTIAITPGQTVDVLLTAAAPVGRYYMTAHVYIGSKLDFRFDNSIVRGILEYKTALPTPPEMSVMPTFNDTPVANRFYTSLTSLVRPGDPTVPLRVDKRMFIVYGLGFVQCRPDQSRCKGKALAASMNNVSFHSPRKKISMLEAHYRDAAEGIYTRDFPSRPPALFDFTNPDSDTSPAMEPMKRTGKGTKVMRLKYNTTVEIVLQNTALLLQENHPLHLHGFNFFVVAQGFGNYNEREAVKRYNLVNPMQRNTLGIPTAGWAVIRFTANNPGMWFFHCHLEMHVQWGLGMVFEVDDGPSPESKLPPPPADFPVCVGGENGLGEDWMSINNSPEFHGPRRSVEDDVQEEM